MFQDHRWAVGGAIGMYAGAAIIFILMAVEPSALQPIDDWWHDLMVTAEAGFLTGLNQVLDFVGGTVVTAPLRAGVAIYLWTQQRWAALTTLLIATGISELAVSVFKISYDRARPLDALVDTSGASFPSGHATAAAVTALVLVIVLVPPGEHRRAWEVRAGVFAFIMALSRTYLRAHWLSDVVAGALLGAATVLATAAIVHVVRIRLRARDMAALAPDV